MRPLKLEIEGFTAFRERVDLDLTTLDLFAITGPTGAGKSSLIDAICYALYGKVPRVANEIKDCISQGLSRMYVSLEFVASDERYRVFRETRRQGQPNVRLERLVEGDWQALAHGATEVTKRVEHVVGLTYDAFTRSVLLPQGQFQEFLSGSPDKRRDVLRALLRLDIYEKVRERASRLSMEQRAQLHSLQSLLDQTYAEATPENLARRRDELDVANSESAGLAARTAVWQQAQTLAQSYASCRDARDKAASDYERAERDVTAATALAHEGGEVISNLESRVCDLESHLAANPFDADLFALLMTGTNLALTLEGSQRKLTDAQAALKARAAAAANAVRAAEAADSALRASAEALDASQHALIEAQRSNLAAALQSGLAPGDACPVCGGKIEALAPVGGRDLTEAESAHAGARSRHDAATRARTEAMMARASAETAIAGVSEVVEQAKHAVEADRRKLEEVLPDRPDRSSSGLQAAMKVQRAAREERLTLDEDLANAQQALAARLREVDAARQDLAAKTHLLEVLRRTLAGAQTSYEKAREALAVHARTNSLAALTAALDSDKAPLAAVQDELNLLSRRNLEIQQEIGRLQMLVDRLKDDIEKADQLRVQVKVVKAEYDVSTDLSQMMGAAKFQAFLQAEALRLLASQGSRRLQELSNQRYRLDINATGQDFEAIDQWNLDEKRSVRTLSGGETFLASLALGLALAESLPGLAPDRRVTLDAIFLDEGFGSLDPDALALAAEALDSLRDGRRMVCVVTHLQELAQRMPARIVVEKSETGSRAAIAS